MNAPRIAFGSRRLDRGGWLRLLAPVGGRRAPEKSMIQGKAERIKKLLDSNYQEELRQTWEKALSSDPIWIKASKGMNISLHKVPEYINVEIPGEIVFGCDRRVWQAYIFYRYVNNKVKKTRPSHISEEDSGKCKRRV